MTRPTRGELGWSEKGMATKIIQNERSIEYQETFFFLSCITLIFNQAAGFLDHQYLLKEAIFVLDFFNQDLYQRKIVLKSNTSGWVWSGVTNHIETFLSLLCGTWLVWRL